VKMGGDFQIILIFSLEKMWLFWSVGFLCFSGACFVIISCFGQEQNNVSMECNIVT
jgi:hypothetical protein